MNDALTVAGRLELFGTSATSAQLTLAKKLGVDIVASTPTPVAAAILQLAVRTELGLRTDPGPASEGQIDYLNSLIESLEIVLDPESLTFAEADGWVKALLALRSAAALQTWLPGPGDVVVYMRTGIERQGIVSSIGADGQVFLRGIGQRTRPENITALHRATEDSTSSLVYEIKAQLAAATPPSSRVSMARMSGLEGQRVGPEVSAAALSAFRDALETATTERPMQVVLERYPELFSRVVSGHQGVWVLPQVKFSDRYMADFLIAAKTSAGISWTLVELERPDVPLLTQGGRLNQTVRGGAQQIEDWREWLLHNAPHAAMAREEGGLGLPYIHARVDGLVIVSRSEPGQELAARPRLAEWESRRIAIRTYDWLLRTQMRQLGLGGGMLDSEFG